MNVNLSLMTTIVIRHSQSVFDPRGQWDGLYHLTHFSSRLIKSFFEKGIESTGCILDCSSQFSCLLSTVANSVPSVCICGMIRYKIYSAGCKGKMNVIPEFGVTHVRSHYNIFSILTDLNYRSWYSHHPYRKKWMKPLSNVPHQMPYLSF